MQKIIYGVIGFIFGAVVSGFVMRKPVVPPAPEPALMMAHDMDFMQMDHSGMTMEGMVQALQGKTGDEFDKIFLAEMIEHHQGAVDMAKMASQSAKHAELKQMTDAIITTQTQEIEQMKLWQEAWGY